MVDAVGCSLDRKTALVTGASVGIGKEIARNLARAGAHVIVVCRNAQRGEEAIRDLQSAAPGARLELELCDLGLREQVAGLCEKVRSKHAALHILVNNAGVWSPKRELTAEGLEVTFATNVLAYHALTVRLAPLLKAGAPARVVNVASRLAFGLDLEDPFLERSFDSQRAYARSKQADRMLSWAFAEALSPHGITVNALHPGTVSTKLFRDYPGLYGALGRLWFKHFGVTAEKGADTATWLAAHPDAAGRTNGYFVKRLEEPCRFRDSTAIARLVELCERTNGIRLADTIGARA